MKPHKLTNQDFSTNFRHWREWLRYPQWQLAEKLGLNQVSVHRIESSKKDITMELIEDMAEVSKENPVDVYKQLREGVTVNNHVENNSGSGVGNEVNVQQVDIELLKALYQQIIEEKQQRIEELLKYARSLERQLGMGN